MGRTASLGWLRTGPIGMSSKLAETQSMHFEFHLSDSSLACWGIFWRSSNDLFHTSSWCGHGTFGRSNQVSYGTTVNYRGRGRGFEIAVNYVSRMLIYPEALLFDDAYCLVFIGWTLFMSKNFHFSCMCYTTEPYTTCNRCSVGQAGLGVFVCDVKALVKIGWFVDALSAVVYVGVDLVALVHRFQRAAQGNSTVKAASKAAE